MASSTFGGVSYFASGPERFVMGRRGELTRGPLVNPNTFTSSVAYDADIELAFFQTGRLVHATVAGLMGDVDEIALRAETLTPATLVDTSGRSWSDMYMLRFTPGGEIDRGRVVSLAYSVFYLRFG